MEKIKFLSLIVPAYRQQATITKNIKKLKKTLQDLGLPFEIIVVVDGKIDNTYNRAIKLKSKKVKILGYKENKGKGYAIKYGVEKAKGDVIGFIDGGMEIDPTGISMLLNHMIWYDADIIVGSKIHPVSQIKYPLWRKTISYMYRLMNKALFGLKVKDTQVGLKLYKRHVAKDVFPRNLVKNFAFDIETLAIAHRLGYTRIYEAPIKLDFRQNLSSISTRNFWKVCFGVFVETLGIYYRLRIKKSYRKNK